MLSRETPSLIKIRLKKAFCTITAALCLGALATICAYGAEENCHDWTTADTDPAKGRYPIELRTCDLTYGLSAFVQIKNGSSTRLVLTYRIVTNDNKHKDSDIVLEANTMTPAGNCQACAARHAGFKSWEILTIKEDSSDKTAAEAAGAAPLPAFMSKPVTAKKPAIEPVKEAEPVVEKPVAVPVAVTPVAAPVPAPVVDKPKVEVAAPEPAPVVAQPKTEAAVPAPEKKEEGFKAEDGTIIPWDQLPPEFRPRK